jgi:hypothetical protein
LKNRMELTVNPDVTFVNAVMVTKAYPVPPQQALADADSGHGRWVDDMCESASLRPRIGRRDSQLPPLEMSH